MRQSHPSGLFLLEEENMYHDLRVEIVKKFKSQANFCVALDLAESRVSRVLHGRKQLTQSEAKQWKKLLDCDGNLLIPVTRNS